MFRIQRRFLLIVRTFTFSRCHPSSIRALLLPESSTSITAVRTLRHRVNESHKSQESEKSSASSSEKEDQENEKEKKAYSVPPIDESLKRKLRLYMVGLTAVSFGITLYLITRMTIKQAEANPEVTPQAIAAPGIALDDFLHNYLQKGEVSKIVFLQNEHKAVAILHEGAIVGGELMKKSVVTVATDLSPPQFWAEIRKVEEALGIPLSQGVELQLQQNIDFWRILKLTIGVFILAWLGSQYGRLIRNRLVSRQSKTPKQ